MTNSPKTHYLNADFDLSLRPRTRRLERPALDRQVRELSVQTLLGTEPGDAALVRTEVPQDFLDYLGECGLSVPRLLVHPHVDPASRLRPFGWSAEAIELNRLHERPAKHPSLSVIRRVNSRSFALELEAELDPEGPSGVVVTSLTELETFLSRATAASEWVIKSEHGNAGLANRRLTRPNLSSADRRFANALFAEDDRLLVEPWLTRERDGCVVFDVPFVSSELRVHETMCTRDGALVGAMFDAGGGECAAWLEELAGTAERIASRLHDEGYFGPVCVDAFTWKDGDRVRLRPLADLNCRLAMSDGAHRLWRALGDERTLFYRFFNRRKLSLPSELPEAVAALGDERYDRSRRRGILFASPLSFTKLAIVFVAEIRGEILALERRFRARFES